MFVTRRLVWLAGFAAFLLVDLASAATVETREAAAGGDWRTHNQFRVQVLSSAPPGVALAVEVSVPQGAFADSVRVLEREGGRPVSRKVEWKRPSLRVSWRSTGAAAYHVYFDRPGRGETERPPAPAMVGAGERITYGRPGVRGKLSVGLHPHPAPLDADGDGVMDLVVSCPDHPYNGIYLFRNIGANDDPLFDRAEWLGPGKRDLLSADFNGDGQIDLVTRGGYYSDFGRNRLGSWVDVELPRDYHVGRDDLWVPADWDGDGRIDLLAGVSDWREYGWDDAYNERGEWRNGPVHGYVYFHRNIGTNEAPRYAEGVRLQAGGRDLDLRGSPAPNPVDWFSRGRLDLIGGDFVDTITLFENIGTRTGPKLATGAPLTAAGKPIRMHLCMLQPRVADWRGDGRPFLLVAEEDGRVAFFKNIAPPGQPARLAGPKFLEQIDPDVKSGVLSRPEAVDWNGDGAMDLLAGNSAGFVQYFENAGTTAEPQWIDRGYLRAGGEVLRIMAGPNLSIQGPIEAKWGIRCSTPPTGISTESPI